MRVNPVGKESACRVRPCPALGALRTSGTIVKLITGEQARRMLSNGRWNATRR